jgi:hypothetical protein
MTSRKELAALALVLVMTLSAFAGFSLGGGGTAAPAASGHALSAGATAHATPMASSAPAAKALAPAAAAPATTCNPHWSGIYFQRDACVTFSVPGANVPPSINYVPFNSTVSQYATGFWMNVSTDYPIAEAILNIWATSWPSVNNSVSGFDPSLVANGQDVHSMQISTANPDTASYFFNIIKYFFPGDTVSFNLELVSTQPNSQGQTASPSKIWSNQTVNVTQAYPSGYVDYPTWEVFINSPWSSTYFQSDIAVSTDPNVLGTPPFDPNPGQAVTVTITSISATNGKLTPIPDALIQYSISEKIKNVGVENSSYSGEFTPLNATIETFTFPQPFPGSTIAFNITGRLPWQGNSGYIDLIVSSDYWFNYSAKGGWWQTTEPLEANAELTSVPNVLTALPTHIPTGTRVNLTVHEPIQNVTISSGTVNFKFDDHGATYIGSVPMLRLDQNTTSIELPGLPANGTMTFSITAKDYYNDPITSANYTYVEGGALNSSVNPSAGQGVLFVEVYDVGAQSLVANANYTIQNNTWAQSGTTAPYGFGKILNPGADTYVYLNDGTYILTIHVFGETIVRAVQVSSPMPLTVVFYVSSSPVVSTASSPTPATFAIGGIIGLVAGAVCSWPILVWYKERRAKAEAEQRRVTL